MTGTVRVLVRCEPCGGYGFFGTSDVCDFCGGDGRRVLEDWPADEIMELAAQYQVLEIVDISPLKTEVA